MQVGNSDSPLAYGSFNSHGHMSHWHEQHRVGEIDERELRVAQLWRLSVSFYQQAIRHVEIVFWLFIICLLVVCVGLGYTWFIADTQRFGPLERIGVTVIASVLLKLLHKLYKHADEKQEKLRNEQQLIEAEQLANSIEDVQTRDQVKSQIALDFAKEKADRKEDASRSRAKGRQRSKTS